MNKIVQITMGLLLVTSLVGCGTSNKNDNANDNKEDDTVTQETTDTNTDQATENGANQNEDPKFELADDVADKIAEMDEVESANVIVTDNNAYVGVVLKEGVEESDDLKSKIADQAKATNGNFNNVYVSSNPDFAEQVTEYGDKIRANEPVEGLFEGFSDTVNRVFPEAK